MKKIYETDPWLASFRGLIDSRSERFEREAKKLVPRGAFNKGINNHLYYGLHRTAYGWVFREWAPNATRIFLVGDFNNWKRTPAYELHPVGHGNWELQLPEMMLSHCQLYKLWIEWPGGGAERIPAYATRVVQDSSTKSFSAQVWNPKPYRWKNRKGIRIDNPLIYECHIGMSSEREAVACFEDFRRDVLPRVERLGYNVLQIMALQEHPYYGSFGYQVSNFFALSSRFGTPEEFKALVDDAHSRGIAVIMDIVHSHSVENVNEGLGLFDGREDLYFYPGAAGHHPAWGSRCFDYGKDEVKFFLLSNCKFWMQEYHLDGFRFDGVTSMLYWDHGLNRDFVNYDPYFDRGVDENAVTYLALANRLVHEINPDAITIAEDMSGMPGLAASFGAGGMGFDFRMSMGVADHWIKWIKEKTDEQWSVGEIWYELTNKRSDERTVSYVECHDQALVGDKTVIFRLIDREMYTSMSRFTQSLVVDRGIALVKLIKLVTIGTAGDGYLNFMGNEFGHPEWIDFPREGNGWSCKYARRQWSLADDTNLRYSLLENFDRAMVRYFREENLLSSPAVSIYNDEKRKILIFRRKNSIFAFNFNPGTSFENYAVPNVPDGKYRLVLNTDDSDFGGFGRIAGEEVHNTDDGTLRLYLPCRCAFVLEKMN